MMYNIPQSANEVPKLEDYLQATRERWRLIVLILLLFILAALAFTRARTPIYEGEARVLVNPSLADATGDRPSNPVLEREKEVISSLAVANGAATKIADGLTGRVLLEDLDVTFVNDSDTLALTYPDPDPDRAALVVNSLAESYVELRESLSLEVYDSQIESLSAEADALQETRSAVIQDLATWTANRTAAIALPGTVTTRQAQIDEAVERVSALTSENNSLGSELTRVQSDLRTISRQKAARRVTAEVLEFASPPDAPAGLSDLLILVGAILTGATAGVGTAFVLDRLDRTARDSSDVEGALGTTVLGNVPTFGAGNKRHDIIMLSGTKNTRSQRVREAYRRTRASLQFLQSSQDISAVLVTSARPGEGKSSTVANLGVAAAQAGSRVVIVSADMRRPMQEKMFGVKTQRGLSNYLADNGASDIMVPVPGVEGLVIVPAGTSPNNPGELLGSTGFADLVQILKDQFDLVLIDTPPILSAADAGSAAPACDGVLVVVDSQRTDTDSLLRVRTTMERSGGVLVGAILNKDASDSGISLRRDRYAYEKVAGL